MAEFINPVFGIPENVSKYQSYLRNKAEEHLALLKLGDLESAQALHTKVEKCCKVLWVKV